ncbi:hypothetical protein [Streptomyces nanshensis]|uniref:Uncharacterized protein n=1 Tax=Streptomyces nanshensis TaxID=518642 RepID=A0A1E7KZG7_9ACTN|nr:hypothetical protein [Streptomyces nanshensis]OEV09304.1 hypothetical protein AN218_22995 [Streptomyces nanshensis]
MKGLLKEISIPFQGIRQAPRLLLVPLMTGSLLIASFGLRRVALVVKLGWLAAVSLDASPVKTAPPLQGQGSAPAEDGAASASGPGTRVSKRAARAAADDAIERIGLGCLILLFVLAVIAGLIWLFMWLVWPHIAPFVPLGVAVLGVVWVIAAWMVAPPLQEPTPRNDHEKSAGEQGQESDQDRFARELVRFIVVAVRDAAPEHGVHIAELLERLQTEARGFGGWDQPRLREWCTAVGIPVSRTLRAKGKGPTWGVRAEELQEAFGTSLDEALEALDRPAVPASSERPAERAATPVQAEEAGPAEAPVPAGYSAPDQPHLHAVPDSSPGVVA